jgi:hypothetical protein
MALRRGFAVALTVISAAALGAAPATAAPAAPETAPPWSQGSGSVGRATGLINGRPISISALAECRVGQRRSATTPGAQVGNLVGFGWGQSTCNSDRWGGTSVQVTGSSFRLGALRQFGGPSLQLGSFNIGCESGWFGSRTNFRVGGLFGIRLPAHIPANYTVWIRGNQPNGQPLAKVVLNEVSRPSPPDGSVSVNLMHVWLFPNSPSIHTGDFVVGSVSCSPHWDH